jgi:protein-tyrosine phosphatase
MVDTHCHLLPGVDDGPRTLDESAELAAALAAAGVESVVCTPHVSRRFPTTSEVASQALAAVRPSAAAAGLTLELAAEFSPAALLETDTDLLPGRAIGARHVLVELKPDTGGDFPRLAAEHLAGTGLTAVFAHPERCRAVQRNLSLVDDARRGGALIQIVASSIAGRWGDTTRRTAWTLLSSARVDLVASDAHRSADAQRLTAVLAELASRLGGAEVERLTEDRPAELLA